MKKLLLTALLVVLTVSASKILANPQVSINNATTLHKTEDNFFDDKAKSKKTDKVLSTTTSMHNVQNNTYDIADVDAASVFYLPRKTIYSYEDANIARKKLLKELNQNPKSIPVRWALIRFYVNASTFVGGCAAKGYEHAAFLYDADNYIGCLAYEFIYTRMKKFDKAEQWYKRSLCVAQSRKDMEWKEFNYNKTAFDYVKVSGDFSNWEPAYLYEGNQGNYTRKVYLSKSKSANYKLNIDDRSSFASVEKQ